MRWRTFAVLAMLLAVLGPDAHARRQPPPLPPPPAPANFSGFVVVDSIGTPIRGAFVELMGTVLVAVTDSAGAFTIVEIPAGIYVVRVRAAGFLQEFFEIEAEDGLDLEGVIALRRAPEDARRETREARRSSREGHADREPAERTSRFARLASRSYPSP